ncbi:MAG: hypothetical protein DRN91_02665 [Candidatus Alkanophagales archaeon]|nr:MAG: hypothetical protein DRN91_02665 [Candidatus Alkanophagales archaeon]
MGIEETLGYINSGLKESMPPEKADSITDAIHELFERTRARGTPIVDFLEALRTETDWLKAPSPKEGMPLIEYSVKVAKELLEIKASAGADVEDESCVVVGLFHEIGLVREDSEGFEEIKGEDPEVRSMRLASRSLRIIARYIPLTPEEAQAIMYHDVQNIPVKRLKLTDLLQEAVERVMSS